MEVDMEDIETKVPKSEPSREEDSGRCRCGELEETSKKAEERIVELELEIGKMKSDYEALEAKFKELEAQKTSAEGELKDLMKRNNEVIEQRKSAEGQMKIDCTGEKGKVKDVVVDLTEDADEDEDEEDIVDQLIVENYTLECEKKKAESEVEVWKEKFKELELWVSRVDESAVMQGGKRLLNDMIKGDKRPDVRVGIEQFQINKKSVDSGPTCSISGTPYKDSPSGHTLAGKKGIYLESEGEGKRLVRRHLSFEERSPNKKLAPPTPVGGNSDHLNVIDICDSDDESDIRGIHLSIPNDDGNRKVCISTDHVLTGTLNGKQDMISDNCSGRVVVSQDYEEDLDDFKDNVPCPPTSKRKRAANIVTSDSESDEGDDIPISKLKKVHLQESIPNTANCGVNCGPMSASPSVIDDIKCTATCSRRHLATLRQCEDIVRAERSFSNKTSEFKHGQGISTMDDVEDSESEELGSGSEGESLGGFIIDNSDGSDADKVSSQSDNKSDGSVDFDEILSQLQRSKDHTFKWELEADMLSAFGKDDELCMKAVCALYRQQTADEQLSKETMYNNKRGFSKFDALRGSDLARFLIDGDPQGDLKKSVQQLEELGSKAVKLCRTLAARYSKQLFEIYKSKEDPLFRPCE
ncbi:uncharacterized protein LOC8274391 [Ricinus communis]|uniref:uncharacterized protein LOC8274391 n=1 Tax=Ricinus communis TaxID=3988 RepID=UPI00201AAA7B|nr:uncharacterized protein LOC8274391 [Ricinus communis]